MKFVDRFAPHSESDLRSKKTRVAPFDPAKTGVSDTIRSTGATRWAILDFVTEVGDGRLA
jgi:hypothetical protein